MDVKLNGNTTDERRLRARVWLYNTFKAQGGKCALCGAGFRLVVDHNHISNKIRGLICSGCNTAIRGMDDIAWARKVLAYCEAETDVDYIGIMREEFIALGDRTRAREIFRRALGDGVEMPPKLDA